MVIAVADGAITEDRLQASAHDRPIGNGHVLMTAPGLSFSQRITTSCILTGSLGIRAIWTRTGNLSVYPLTSAITLATARCSARVRANP